MSKIDVSIVIPVCDEEPNLEMLADKIHEVMSKTDLRFECLYIDDGSTDNSQAIIRAFTKKYSYTHIISFRRHYGQTAALAAGFDHAKGDVIVTLDADLQNDPSDIPALVQKLGEGYDLVSGWRKDRKDSWLRKKASFFANKLIAHVTGVSLHDFGCTLKAYRRKVVEELRLYGEMHRFIPALASWSGIEIVEMPVRHHPRLRGKSKYGISRTFRVVLDLMTVKFLLSYSTRPIQIFGKVGLFASFLGFVFLLSAIILKYTSEHSLTNHPFFMLFILLEMIGIQCIFIGLLAELTVRIYHETQKKKTYVVKYKN